MTHSLFEGVDPAGLAFVTLHCGLGFAGHAAKVGMRVANDDAISPDALVAGIVKAHLAGAASALGGWMNIGQDKNRGQLADECADFILAALKEMAGT